jgi:hypothetical protein
MRHAITYLGRSLCKILLQHFQFTLNTYTSPMSQEGEAWQGIGDTILTGNAIKLNKKRRMAGGLLMRHFTHTGSDPSARQPLQFAFAC